MGKERWRENQTYSLQLLHLKSINGRKHRKGDKNQRSLQYVAVVCWQCKTFEQYWEGQ